LHDATGDLDKVPQLVDFWVRPEILEVLRKHEAYLLLNIANEAGDGNVKAEAFTRVYQRAIERLRAAGLRMPLVIDAPRWGQDIDVLQATAPALMQADPRRSILFSAHLWWPKPAGSADPGSTKQIIAELGESAAMELPLIVGEFAHAGVGCSRSIDYKAIIAEAQKHQIGWLAWSWGPGNNDCREMDMTQNGSFETLRGWGLEVAVTDPNSIRNTSKRHESSLRGECPHQ
ncbi:MAG TPA: cellulase family glycosylhydrolase, partial [Polyangiaceae bacterium]